MKTKVMLLGLLLALAGFPPLEAFAQEDEDVRGAFMTTRPKPSGSANKSGPAQKPNRRRPKPTTTSTVSAEIKVGPTAVPVATTNTPKTVFPRMGLGLTLFMRDSNGLAVRTDPSREFRKGDRVRVLLETNADGYLYIFNTTNDGHPVMIYPDPELDEAGNYIQAHVPFEIPSSVAAEERLRWFAFDQNAGAEKLYFVFTREPLSAVPIEDDLITFCRDNKTKCPWQPGTDVWAQVKKEVNEPTKTARAQNFGNKQTSAEQQATTRGIGLNRDDPEPSLIMLTTSTNKNVLVATLDLVHKAVSLVVE
jgi:hypothetical protein